MAIAKGMHSLHKHDIIYRDLKASNVLIPGSNNTFDLIQDEIDCCIADYECSIGVVGVVDNINTSAQQSYIYTVPNRYTSFNRLLYS